MMQSADLGYSNDCNKLRWLDVPRDRCISLQGDMRPGLVVVTDVFAEDLSEVIFAEDDQVVQAFAPDRSDDSLGVGVLPEGLRGSDDLDDGTDRRRWSPDHGADSGARFLLPGRIRRSPGRSMRPWDGW